MNDFQPAYRKRNRRRSISISDDLWDKVKKECKGCVSVSWFVRKCVEKEVGGGD